MSFCIPRPQELVISEVDNPFGSGMKMAPGESSEGHFRW
jgi:hypothetical protein